MSVDPGYCSIATSEGKSLWKVPSGMRACKAAGDDSAVHFEHHASAGSRNGDAGLVES